MDIVAVVGDPGRASLRYRGWWRNPWQAGVTDPGHNGATTPIHHSLGWSSNIAGAREGGEFSGVKAKWTKPHRVVRRRTKDWKMPANTVYVGRPTVWGNPFVVGSEMIGGEKLTATKSVALYRQYARDAFNERDLRACLRGKNLACWCPLGQPCHADVLLEMANSA